MPALATAALSGGGQNVPGGNPNPAPNASATPGVNTPFATPQPTGTPGPIGNGFVVLGYDGASASGGIIPFPASTASPPAQFPPSNAGGFYGELTGRLSPTYAASLRFHDYVVHGADMPVVNLSEGDVVYMPGGGLFAFGLGYASWQRSSSNASANGAGLGAALMPDLRHAVSPYASFFYYPSARTSGVTAAISSAQAGIALRPTKSGVLVQFGYDYIGYPNQSMSPNSLSGFQAGLGVSF